MKKIKFGLLNQFLFLLFIIFISSENIYSQNCTVNAGIPEIICQNAALQLKGNADGLFGTSAIWSQMIGSSVNILNPAALNSSVTGYLSGQVYTFRISATCQDGVIVYDDVNFTINAVSVANAGTDQQSCPGNGVITLNANTAEPNETGSWSIVSNAGGISGLAVSNPQSTINLSGSSSGISILRWTFQHLNGCSSYDDVAITNNGGILPVFAGNDLTLSNCYTATQTTDLTASFAGDNTGGQQGIWSLVSGPNYPVFVDIQNNNTSVSNLIEGVYVFRWEVTGPCINGMDEIIVTVPKATQGLTTAYGADLRFCYGASSIVLEGTVPLYANEVGTWTQTGGPTVANIINPNSAITTVTGLNGINTYRFLYTITNTSTGCSTQDNTAVRFTQPPSMNVGQDQVLACSLNSVLISPISSGGTSTRYKIINGPFISLDWIDVGNGNVTINNLNNEGTYTIQFERYSVGTGCTSAFDDINVSVSEAPSLSNAGTDQILACSVVETDLAGNSPLNGSGRWSQIRGPNTALIANPLNASSHISGLIEGAYTFRWVVSGGNNCPVTQDDVLVVVSEYTPAVAAGNDRSVCHSTEINLEGNTPKPGAIGTWAVTPGNEIIFSDSRDPHSAVLGMKPSTDYIFTWTISNQCKVESADVKITTGNTAGPSPAFAGPDQCESTGTITLNMNGNNPSVGSGNWTILSGPNIPTISDKFSPITTVTGMVDGHYLIEWSINVPGCISTRDTLMASIAIGVTQSNAGADESLCGNSVVLSANSPGTNETGRWKQISGNSGYTISDIHAHDALFNNLLPGRYEFAWIIEKGICPASTDNLVIKVTQKPDASVTVSDFAVCGGTNAVLSANSPILGVGVWSVVGTATNSPTISSISSPSTDVLNLATGSYRFRWTITTGSDCNAEIDDINIQVSAPAVAEPDRNLCNATETFLEGTLGTDGTWSISPANTGIPTPSITNTNVHTATVSGMTLDQTYTFRYTVPAIFGCPSTFDDLTVATSPYGTSPNAGPDQEICLSLGNSVFMAANSPGTGFGNWRQLSGPNTANIVNPILNNTQINGMVAGIYVFEWNVDYNHCGNYSDVIRVTVNAPPTPSNAGPNQLNACQLNTQLAGNLPSIGIGNWSLVSAPTLNAASIVTIDNPGLPDTKISNVTDLGDYIFRWTTTNGSVCLSSSTDVTIKYIAAPPTVPNAGADQDLCSAISLNMAGNNPATGNGSWSQISGPSSALINNPNSNSSSVTNIFAGTYEFQWKIVSGGCSLTDNVIIVNSSTPPIADASGTDSEICQFELPLLIGNNPSSGSGLWSFVSGPSTPIISSPDNSSSNVTGTVTGAYIFKWTISNGACPKTFDDVTVNIVNNPSNVLTVSGNTVCQGVNGSVIIQSSENKINYELFIGSNSVATAVGDGGDISVTVLANKLSLGNNYINIKATNSNGCKVSNSMQAEIVVNPNPLKTINVSDDEVCENSNANITLTLSQSGVRYDAYNGTTLVGTCNGNNGNSDINISTDASWIGTNTISFKATNIATICTSVLDNNSIIKVNANPLTDIEVAGNTICLGSNGKVTVRLSENGVIYKAFVGAIMVGTAVGNGSDIDISINTGNLVLGNNTVVLNATNITTLCTVNLINQATVKAINPPLQDRLVAGNSVCQNSNGTVTVFASENGVIYQLYKGVTLVGSGIGTGNDLLVNVDASFLSIGLNSIDILADNSVCTNYLAMKATIIVNANPNAILSISGSTLCNNSDGNLTITASELGVNYEAFIGLNSVSTASGNNNDLIMNILKSNLSLGINTVQIIATNATTRCAVNMINPAIINVNPNPNNSQHIVGNTVCDGTDGQIIVQSSESGISYNVFKGLSNVGFGNGNGSILNINILSKYLNLGNNPFSVVATNLLTGCTNNMIENPSIIVNINPDKTLHAGGNLVCEGANGLLSVQLSESDITYSVYNGSLNVGMGTGKGSKIDITILAKDLIQGNNLFNLVATNPITGCSSALTENPNIIVQVNPNKSLHLTGNIVCDGADGQLNIQASEANVTYTVFKGLSTVGLGNGNGGNLNIAISAKDLIPGSNSFSLTATNTLSGCSSTMVENPAIIVNTNPNITITLSGNTICDGSNGMITLINSENNVTYEASINSSVAGTGIGTGQNLNITINSPYLKPGNNILNVRATKSGCKSDLINTANIQVNSNPQAKLSVKGNEICENSNAQVSIIQAENGVNYEAFISSVKVGSGTVNSNLSNLIIDVSGSDLNLGNNQVNFVARNTTTNCIVNLNNLASIDVNPNPISSLAVSNNEICYGDEAILTISSSEIDIKYDFTVNGKLAANGIGNGSDLNISVPPSYLNIGSNPVSILATNLSTTCSIPLDNTGNIEYKYCNIIVYDGFSPNKDGINETFIIEGLERYPTHKVLIFNRWGNKVYEASPYLNDWDGTNMFGVTVGGKDLPVGTYYYIIEPGNSEKAIKGYIYLTR